LVSSHPPGDTRAPLLPPWSHKRGSQVKQKYDGCGCFGTELGCGQLQWHSAAELLRWTLGSTRKAQSIEE
jgi:hypothetical protein